MPLAMLGYSNWEGQDGSRELRRQAERIASACSRRGLTLLELVRERDAGRERAYELSGLGYAMQRIRAGEAQGLVVAELSCLTCSAPELARLLECFSLSNARFIAAVPGLDTRQEGGRLAARTIIDISRQEHPPHAERTRLLSGDGKWRPTIFQAVAGHGRPLAGSTNPPQDDRVDSNTSNGNH